MKKWKQWVIYTVIIGIIGGCVLYVIYQGGSRNAVSGIGDPIQTDTEGSVAMTVNEYHMLITYLYQYDIEALVVHTKDYHGFSVGDALSPKDLALAWGTVAEHNKDVDFHWSQHDRWYYWRVDTPQELGIAGGEYSINRQSSNNHIIPANDDIRKKVSYIRRGDHVRLQGYLVSVSGRRPSDGATFSWTSSTSRTDTGDGACEVFYVTNIEQISN